MKTGTTLCAAILAALVTGTLVAGIAWAAAPGTSPMIRSCVSKKTGAIRILRAKKNRCTAKEAVLMWNQQGPAGIAGTPGTPGAAGAKGSTGAKGATGATGATGPAGATGLTGVHGVSKLGGPWTTSGLHTVTASCPGVEDVVGIGYQIVQGGGASSSIGSAAARVDGLSQSNKLSDQGTSSTGRGSVFVTIDATKLPAGKSVTASVHITCAKTT